MWEPAAVEQLKTSIEKFGLLDALIVNTAPGRENRILGGNFRWSIAKDLGIEEVPIVTVDIPDPKVERELSLRLNSAVGDWDYEILKEFDISLLLDVGFDDSTLSAIWDNALAVDDDHFEVEKELERITEPVTRPGDLYQLGSNALICGDGTDPKVVARLVGDTKVNALYFDPPFNISLSYDKGLGSKSSYGGHLTDDNKSEAEYRVFLQKLLENGLAVAADDVHVFSFCDARYIGLLQELYAGLGIDFRRLCLWIKGPSNPTPKVAFNRSTEPVVYGTRGIPYLAKDVKNLGEVINREIGGGNRAIDDIIDLLEIWLTKRDPSADYRHPTQKPPTLHEKPLRRCTKPGDAVLDLCSGSGSLMTACTQLKRRAFMCELECRFCDVTIRRFEKLTGQKAKLVGRAK